MFDQQLVMKMFRRLEPGPNPDVEIGAFLADRGFARVPALTGTVEYTRPGSDPASPLMLQRYVWNQGNGWQVTIEEISRFMERAIASSPPALSAGEARAWLWSDETGAPAPVVEAVRAYLATAEVIGRRTGELHLALASGSDAAFAPEPLDRAAVEQLVHAVRAHGERQLRQLELALPILDDRRHALAEDVLARAEAITRGFDAVAAIDDAGRRIRVHGDYHLGQVLITEGDVAIIDFEGEPARPLAERRRKWSPLRDVAGMLRSFGYAALTALTAATRTRPDDTDRLRPWAELWEAWVGAAFLRAYLTATHGAGILPSRREAVEALLHVFVLDKALYELGYELNNRPDWIHVPLTGLLRLSAEPPPSPAEDPGVPPPLHA
jgi:trehalose synthase-fused probable maltokinase